MAQQPRLSTRGARSGVTPRGRPPRRSRPPVTRSSDGTSWTQRPVCESCAACKHFSPRKCPTDGHSEPEAQPGLRPSGPHLLLQHMRAAAARGASSAVGAPKSPTSNRRVCRPGFNRVTPSPHAAGPAPGPQNAALRGDRAGAEIRLGRARWGRHRARHWRRPRKRRPRPRDRRARGAVCRAPRVCGEAEACDQRL